MPDNRDGRTSSGSPIRRSIGDRQLNEPRGSRIDRAPGSTKRTSIRHSTAYPDRQDPNTGDIVASPRLQSTSNPSTRDRDASQPCVGLRQLTTVDGGDFMQRIYAMIQRQRDEWYQGNSASGFPPQATANPQNENTRPTTGQRINNQGHASMTPGVVSDGTTGIVSSSDYTEHSRVLTPSNGSDVSEFSRGPMQNGQGQTPRMPRQVMPGCYKETQSVRFQTPIVSPSHPKSFQTSGLATAQGNLPYHSTPSQDISGGTLDSTALQHTGQDISGGTLESSTTLRQRQDISGGMRQSSLSQRQSQGHMKVGQQNQSQLLSGQFTTDHLSSIQRPTQNAKRETSQVGSRQQSGSDDPPGYTQPNSSRQPGTSVSGVAAKIPRDTMYSDAQTQSGTEASSLPQTLQASGRGVPECYCACLTRLALQHKGYLQQPATQPLNCPPLWLSCVQPLLGYQPEAYHSGVQPPLGLRPETYHSDVQAPLSSRPKAYHSDVQPPLGFQHETYHSDIQAPLSSRPKAYHRGVQDPRSSRPEEFHSHIQSPLRSRPETYHSHVQPPLGFRPEAYHSGITLSGPPSSPNWSQQSNAGTSIQASAGSFQHLSSSQYPETSGMQMSKEASPEYTSSKRPAESGQKAPEEDPPKAADASEGPRRLSIGHVPQVSEPLATSDSIGKELRGQEPTGHDRRQIVQREVEPTAQTTDDQRPFEEQVSAEFKILKELALSLRNLRYLPNPVPPPVGTAFENCVLSELRSIRSRCAAYSQPGLYNRPGTVAEGNGSCLSTEPHNANQPLDTQEPSQGQIPNDSSQVSTFEQKVIAALRSINRSCEGGTNAFGEHSLSSPVEDTINGQSPSSATRLFEELVLGKLNELGKEFYCKQTPPAVSGVDPAQELQGSSEPVPPLTDPTSNTKRTSHHAGISQGGARRSSDAAQQDQSRPGEQSFQPNTTQNQIICPGSGVNAMEPSYIRASSQGRTPFTGRIGSLTFDTTASSSNEINRSKQNDNIQRPVEPIKEVTPAENTLRRSSLNSAVRQQSEATGQTLVQRQTLVEQQSRADQLPHPPNISWADNEPTSQRISEAPERSLHVQETFHTRPTVIGPRVDPRLLATSNRGDRTTDECETGTIDGDSCSDEDSIDSCSPQRLGVSRIPYVSPRQQNLKRKSNQPFVDCDYLYRRQQLATFNDHQQRASVPVQCPTWPMVGQGAPSGPAADLTQYTMSETQPSLSPQLITEPGSASNNIPRAWTRSSAAVALSSTLKEGHVPPTRATLPSELPSIIESERHRIAGNHDESQVVQNRTFGQQPYGGSNGPQQSLPLETGLRSSFDCSEIYYRVASNAPLVDRRYRPVFPYSSACDQLVQEAGEKSLCSDDDPCQLSRSGLTPRVRDESDCMTGSGFQRGRLLVGEGRLRSECATPLPRRARPSGVPNRYPPSQALNFSGERLRPSKKTFTHTCSRRSSKQGRRSYGKPSGLQPMSAAGTDPRYKTKTAAEIRRNVLNCMEEANSRSKFAEDPCASSESETDCEF